MPFMIRIRATGLFLLLAATVSLAQDFVTWLPEKTVAYASVENAARMRERMKKSAFAAMWNDPAMEALRGILEKKFEQSEDGEAGKASPTELLDLLQGQVCMAGVPVGTSKTAGVFLIDLKEKKRELLDLMERLDDEEDGELRKEEEDFHGYTLVTYRRLKEGAEEPEVEYRFTKDDLFGWSDDLDVLKDIITRREAGDKTGLSAAESHKKVLAATAQRADVRWFVSSSLWLREFGMMAAPVLAALGMEQVKGLGGQITFAERGVQTQIVIQNEGEPRGLMKLLGGNIENLGPPALLPADVDPTFTVALDWQLIYTEALRVLALFEPNAVAQVEAMVGQFEKQIGMRLHDDVFGAMAPGLTYAFLPIPEEELANAPKGAAFAQFATQFVVVFQKLRNAETIQTLLTKLTQEEGSPFKEVVYLGTRICESEMPALPAFAIIDGQLAFGLRPDSLRALIQRQGKELKGFRDTDAYKRGLALVPAKRSLFMVSNPRGNSGASLFWTGFRSGIASTTSDPAVMEALPPVEFLDKYQDVSVLSVSTEEQGLLISWFWGLKASEAGESSDDDG